jgi:hypothetical protein
MPLQSVAERTPNFAVNAAAADVAGAGSLGTDGEIFAEFSEGFTTYERQRLNFTPRTAMLISHGLITTHAYACKP